MTQKINMQTFCLVPRLFILLGLLLAALASDATLLGTAAPQKIAKPIRNRFNRAKKTLSAFSKMNPGLEDKFSHLINTFEQDIVSNPKNPLSLLIADKLFHARHCDILAVKTLKHLNQALLKQFSDKKTLENPLLKKVEFFQKDLADILRQGLNYKFNFVSNNRKLFKQYKILFIATGIIFTAILTSIPQIYRLLKKPKLQVPTANKLATDEFGEAEHFALFQDRLDFVVPHPPIINPLQILRVEAIAENNDFRLTINHSPESPALELLVRPPCYCGPAALEILKTLFKGAFNPAAVSQGILNVARKNHKPINDEPQIVGEWRDGSSLQGVGGVETDQLLIKAMNSSEYPNLLIVSPRDVFSPDENNVNQRRWQAFLAEPAEKTAKCLCFAAGHYFVAELTKGERVENKQLLTVKIYETIGESFQDGADPENFINIGRAPTQAEINDRIRREIIPEASPTSTATEAPNFIQPDELSGRFLQPILDFLNRVNDAPEAELTDACIGCTDQPHRTETCPLCSAPAPSTS